MLRLRGGWKNRISRQDAKTQREERKQDRVQDRRIRAQADFTEVFAAFRLAASAVGPPTGAKRLPSFAP